MEVHHRQRGQHVGLDQPAVGHDHAQLGAGADHVVDPVGDGQAQLDGGRLHRARHQRAAPSPAAVGTADHEGHVVAGVDEGPQRTDRHLRRPQEGQPHEDRAGR